MLRHLGCLIGTRSLCAQLLQALAGQLQLQISPAAALATAGAGQGGIAAADGCGIEIVVDCGGAVAVAGVRGKIATVAAGITVVHMPAERYQPLGLVKRILQ